MILNSNILKEKKACESGQMWFEKYFSDGISLIDLISNERIPIDFLHWGYNNLSTSKEEKQAYWEKLKIYCDNPYTINYSRDVLNSSYIMESRRIKNSNYISSSKNIENSNIVLGCSNIFNSKQIFNSSQIKDSERIYISNEIKDSKNILLSNNIQNCKSIINCENCQNSCFIQSNTELNKCENIFNSYFINNGNNLNNCLFCSNINDVNYYCFNQQISESKFLDYKLKIEKYLYDYNNNYIINWGQQKMPIDFPVINDKEIFYKTLPQEFVEWVYSLPEFDIEIWQQIYNNN